jgi:hypothetical protein
MLAADLPLAVAFPHLLALLAPLATLLFTRPLLFTCSLHVDGATNDMDAHAHEGAAAAAAVADEYGLPRLEIAVGRQVWGSHKGRRFTGTVAKVGPHGVDLECDGAWLANVPHSAITMMAFSPDELPF